MRHLSLVFGFAVVIGCSGPPPNKCVGGIILDGGECVAKCDPSKCVANNTCVNNECKLKCDSHFDCTADSQRCQAATEDDTGANILICVDVDLKGVGVACPLGNECSSGTSCHTSGLGDTTAYCTTGCGTDSECPGGYECDFAREPTFICETMDAGESYCGKAPATCTHLADILLNPWNRVGNVCVEQGFCTKRTQCSSCTADPDCSLTNEKCVQVGLGNRCMPACTVYPDGGTNDKDCAQGFHCVVGTCLPIYNDCTASPPGFCTPCRNDSDCETDGGTFECEPLHGTEKSCIDSAFRATCTTNANCPQAPSGLHGHCFNESDGFAAGDALYHHCYAPSPILDQYSCYPAH